MATILEHAEKMLRGEVPPPPIARLLGFVLKSIEPGRAVFEMEADERHHNQAAVLAAQSQEQLRTEPAGILSALESSPHGYTRLVGGTTYTIPQEAKAINASKASTGCNVAQTGTQTGANVQITSSVTWPLLVTAKRPSVRESSIITPPTGSALEVDVGNAPARIGASCR